MTRIAICALAMTVACPALSGMAQDMAADQAAAELLRKADQRYSRYEVGEAIRLYRAVIDSYPTSPYRYTARLRLGRCSFQKNNYNDAISHLHECAAGSQIPEEQAEALYLTGMAYYEQKDYEKTIPAMRRVLQRFAETEYGDRAYYIIGMVHLRMSHYRRALDAFEMIGAPSVGVARNALKVCPGQPLCIRVSDRDLATDVGSTDRAVTAQVRTTSGDEERVRLRPVPSMTDDFVGAAPTELGDPCPGDGTIQLTGADEVIVDYLDARASDGRRNVLRRQKTTVAADAHVSIVDPAFHGRVDRVIVTQDAYLRVIDCDRDRGPGVDTVDVLVRVKRRIPGNVARGAEDQALRRPGGEEQYWIIDEERIRLSETPRKAVATVGMPNAAKSAARASGDDDLDHGVGHAERQVKDSATQDTTSPPCHSGVFVGAIPVRTVKPRWGDGILSGQADDIIGMDYTDDIPFTKDKPNSLRATAFVFPARAVAGPCFCSSLRGRPAHLYLHPRLEAAETRAHMGRVAKDLGLLEQADRQFAQALWECREVERAGRGDSPEVIEQIQYLGWKIHAEKGDYPSAERACRNLFWNFPDSEYTDDALMVTGNLARERRDYPRAIGLYTCLIQTAPPGGPVTGAGGQVPTTSPLAPDAQYAIAECYESIGQTNPSFLERALTEYRKCADLYPVSKFAPPATLRIGDYYYRTADYCRALCIYDRMLRDYPDYASDFIALILLRYGKCLVMLGEYPGARARFEQVLDEHPDSEHVETAQRYIRYIEKAAGRAYLACPPPKGRSPTAPGNGPGTGDSHPSDPRLR